MINWRRLLFYLIRLSATFVALLLTLTVLLIIADSRLTVVPWSLSGWRLLCDLLPFLLVLLLGYCFLAPSFIKGLYGLETIGEARNYLRRRLFGRTGFKPFLLVKEGQLIADNTLKQIGGDGAILAAADTAVVTERIGVINRVLLPTADQLALAELEPFERAWEIIDLRPKHRVFDVAALSKEGLPVKCTVDMHYRISTGGQQATSLMPIPVDRDAVLNAAVGRWMRDNENSPDDRTYDWSHRVGMSDTKRILRGILAQYPLDVLVGLDDGNVDRARIQIRDQLMGHLSDPENGVGRYGAEITQLHLGKIQVDDDVFQQWISLWQTRWENRVAPELATAQARREYYLRHAKTSVQAQLIKRIAHGLRTIDDDTISDRVIITRLFQVIEEYEKELYQFLPTTSFDAISEWHKLVGDESPLP